MTRAGKISPGELVVLVARATLWNTSEVPFNAAKRDDVVGTRHELPTLALVVCRPERPNPGMLGDLIMVLAHDRLQWVSLTYVNGRYDREGKEEITAVQRVH